MVVSGFAPDRDRFHFRTLQSGLNQCAIRGMAKCGSFPRSLLQSRHSAVGPVSEVPLCADTVEKHIVLVFSGSRIRPEWRDVRDHVWSGLSNVGALQRTCGTIYLRTSDAACLGKISRDAQLWIFQQYRPGAKGLLWGARMRVRTFPSKAEQKASLITGAFTVSSSRSQSFYAYFSAASAARARMA